MVYTQYTVTATFQQIIASNSNSKKRMLLNPGPNTLFIGSTTSVVPTPGSANGGYPIPASDMPFYLNDYTGILYGVCKTSETASIFIIEEELS